MATKKGRKKSAAPTVKRRRAPAKPRAAKSRAAAPRGFATRSGTVAAASAVSVLCKPDEDKAATLLRVSRGETIRYEVSFKGAQGTFAIVDQHGAVILSNQDAAVAPGQYVRDWPRPGDNVKVPDDLNHTLGMHFIAATAYAYRATRLSSTGATLEKLKNCTYQRGSQTDSFFDPLRVFTA